MIVSCIVMIFVEPTFFDLFILNAV